MATHGPVSEMPLPPTSLRADQAFAVARLDDGRFAAPDVAVDTGAVSSGGYGSSETPAMPAVATFDADWTGVKLRAGHTRQMSPEDRADVQAYLETV